MRHAPPIVATVPFLAADIVSVEGLADIADRLRA